MTVSVTDSAMEDSAMEDMAMGAVLLLAGAPDSLSANAVLSGPGIGIGKFGNGEASRRETSEGARDAGLKGSSIAKVEPSPFTDLTFNRPPSPLTKRATKARPTPT